MRNAELAKWKMRNGYHNPVGRPRPPDRPTTRTNGTDYMEKFYEFVF